MNLDITTEYRIVNYLFVLILLCAILAPVFFYIPSVSNQRYCFSLKPPGSFYTKHTGKTCSSTGLTRSVLALYQGDLALSRHFNKTGCWLITLIFIQLALRPFIFWTLKYNWGPWLDITQIFISGILFKVLLEINFSRENAIVFGITT